MTQVTGIDYLSGMDLDVNAILTKYGELITNEAKADIRNKSVTQYGSVNASGDLDKSIRYEVKDGKLTVYGLDYSYYVEKGRKGGKRPPFNPNSTKFGVKVRGKNKGKPRGDFENISRWLDNKPSARQRFGYDLKTQAQKASLVYMIANKIAEKGTTAYQQGGTKLFEDILNPTLIGGLQSEINLLFKNVLISQLKSAIVNV